WLALFGHTAPSFASAFTPEDVNAITLQNTAVTALVRVVQFMGVDPAAELPFTGTFDSHDWSWNLSGSYAEQPASFVSTGTFDASANTGSWTTVGFFGGRSLTSSGDVAFAPDSLSFQFNEIGIIDFIPPRVTVDGVTSSSYEERGSNLFRSTTVTQYSI